ncbi:MAG: copper resistance protein NlpE N-terminal domain-containing protein [Longimicrobiales bacterium]
MARQRLIHLSSIVLLAASCTGNPDSTDQPGRNAADPAPDAALPDGHTSRNSLDWAGTYSGVLPCADCPGIETVLTLHEDGTFEQSMHYLERAVAPLTSSGTFTWGEDGGRITLDVDGDGVEQYLVGENQLFRLDQNGNRITGNLAQYYVLRKHVRDPAIEDRQWQLVELRGQPVQPGQEGQDVVLTLRAEDSTAFGNASCNNFTGGYAIKAGQQIRFARNMAVTMKACPDMSTEAAFLEVLEMADNYTLGEDGVLSLNRARMAPLARFEVAGEG